MGYSWGGGTVIDLSENLKQEFDSRKIDVHMALIDAVELGSFHFAKSAGYNRGENYRPNAKSLFNRYQENSSPNQEELFNGLVNYSRGIGVGSNSSTLIVGLFNLVGGGNPARGRGYLGLEVDDQVGLKSFEHHLSIDDAGTVDRDEHGNPKKDSEGNEVNVIDAAIKHITDRLT